ncbi:hypothetical protein Hypma_014918 [Hypsizygus marmoreus]|uniref:Secreted protein n=1 Tax=Hypsizygus marmoreus TaxID=39966 RepID=A0A369KEK4_HYPMA|nr:hypothetical protein Hypma_014918 [Hypsizygus marmoreus]
MCWARCPVTIASLAAFSADLFQTYRLPLQTNLPPSSMGLMRKRHYIGGESIRICSRHGAASSQCCDGVSCMRLSFAH